MIGSFAADASPRAGTRRRRGFTLIEIMAVMAIVGIMLLAIVPALDNMLPGYRLGGDARKIAATAELAQGEAVSQRAEMILAYDLDEETYWIILPEREEEDAGGDAPPAGGLGDALGGLGLAGADEEQPDIEHGPPPPDPAEAVDQTPPPDFTERDALTPTRLGDGVEFELVQVGDEEKRSGRVYVPFDPLGTTGTHLVALKLVAEPGEEGAQVWIKFNAMTRTIEYAEQRPELRVLPADGS